VVTDDEVMSIEREVEFLRGLAGILQEEGLSEITVAHEGWSTTLKSAVVSEFVPASNTVPLAPVTVRRDDRARPAKSVEKLNLVPVVAPMVGVFYRAPSPGDPNFVEVGDHVEAGQIVGLMEAMKVFNDITTDVEGTVAEILTANGQLVETGNALMQIRVAPA